MDGYIIAIIGFAGAVGAVILSNIYNKKNNDKANQEHREKIINEIINKYENKFITIELKIDNAIDKYTTEIRTIKSQLIEIKNTNDKIDELKDLVTEFKLNLTQEIADIKSDIKIINKK